MTADDENKFLRERLSAIADECASSLKPDALDAEFHLAKISVLASGALLIVGGDKK